FEVEPVLRPVEHDFADREVFGREYSNLAVQERDELGAPAHGGMKLVVSEEQVDRGVVPPRPALAVTDESLGVFRLGNADRAEQFNNLRVVLGRDEDVYVQVDGRPRLAVVGKCDRAAERMWRAPEAQRVSEDQGFAREAAISHGGGARRPDRRG